MLKRILTPFASLKLTVVLLALSMLLVYAGTWAQIDQGIKDVEDHYFHSLFAWVNFKIFFPREWNVYGGFPMPGGYGLGILLLLNLVAAHTVRFQMSWKRLGIHLIHVGIILLLVGEGIRSSAAIEGRMVIDEGSYSNYSQDTHEVELALVDSSPGDSDNVIVVRQRELTKPGRVISHWDMPFQVKVEKWMVNADIELPDSGTDPNQLVHFRDRAFKVVERPTFSGTSDAEKVDTPAALVTLLQGEKTIGTYAVAAFNVLPKMVQLDGKTYEMQLRNRRYYKPYRLHLIDFRFDRYPGTNVPKNYSSLVRLEDPGQNENREVKIWMNHPLRYGGETYFQSSFDDRTETTTVLQVVKNPGWLLPYIACVIGGIGLLVHFGIMLVAFVRRRNAAIAEAAKPVPVPARGGKGERYVLEPVRPWKSGAFLFPAAILALCLVYVFSHALPRDPGGNRFNIRAFGRLPILFDGRVQPLDSLARNSAKVLSGRESIKLTNDQAQSMGFESRSIPAIQWLLDVFARPDTSEKYPVIRIDDPDVKNLLGLDGKTRNFSIQQLAGQFPKLQQQIEQANATHKSKQTKYQRSVLELANKLQLYMRLVPEGLGRLHVTPPIKPGEDWQTLADAFADRENPHPAAKAFLDTLTAYNTDKAPEFNSRVIAYEDMLQESQPSVMTRVNFESWFNRFDPSMLSMVFYVTVLVFAALSWLGWSEPLWRASYWVLLLSLVIHTFAIGARIYISGRPPVTNLASSAIFIGWGAVLIAAFAEHFYRNGIGSVSAAIVGFTTLVIYQKLSLDGDTMKVLQAVLDTNIWLATHVVMITLGYSATFLAGALAIIYVVRGVFTKAPTELPRTTAAAKSGGSTLVQGMLVDLKTLSRMIYGVSCFAILFSFIGTVLGGIWADQSWGRVWGWDPKENGAVLIVLANAIVLHARWGGLVRDRGVAILAIFGNIVTAWSWFGTNMLGVGLHSYGFMDSALGWLMLFVISQLLLIAIANIPLRHWRSFSGDRNNRGGLPVKMVATP
jgi:cytochrome c-type biogenesis protein CcsB